MNDEDYLTSIAYKPGEFERLYVQHDKRQHWLTGQLKAPMKALLRDANWVTEAVEHMEAVWRSWSLKAAKVPSLLDDSARDEAWLLAGQALSFWEWYTRELPDESLPDRALRVASLALRQQGLEGSTDLLAALVEAMSDGYPPRASLMPGLKQRWGIQSSGQALKRFAHPFCPRRRRKLR